MQRNLKTLAQLAQSGPWSVASLRWLIQNRVANGLGDSGAIIRVGRRIYVDVDRFDRWLDSGRAAGGVQ